MAVTTKTNKKGATVTTRTRKNGTTVKKVTGKNGNTRKVTTKASGAKIKTRKDKDGKVLGGRTTNKSGKVTSITRTKKDGTSVTKDKGSVSVKAANIAKSGKGKNAKTLQDLKAKKKAARKSGDTAKLTALRKKSQATRKTIKKNVRTRRAAES